MKNFFTSIRLILFFLFVVLISVDLERDSVHVQNFADFEEVIDNWDRTNVSSLIQINNEADVLSKRNDLIEYIWKDEFPDSDQVGFMENVVDSSYEDIESLEKIDAFRVIMENQVSSIAYHFKAHNSNGNLIIYVQGHKGDFYWGRETIKFFLDNNYDVLAFSMPLMGIGNENYYASATTEFGALLLADHNAFFYLETEEFSPIKYYVHPIAVVLNYLAEDYDTIAMTGISGGGWTTTLYSALDPRIDKSYPVSGSHPLYLYTNNLRMDLSLGGDYEYFVKDLYEISNFLELYILGSYGEGRNQVQILNEFDDCCYAGTGYLTYEGIVSSKVSLLGLGNFEVFSDTSHQTHNISSTALQVILEDITK
tara:strand:+ start:8209 stop:9309 length:1101 start_codon:yes stop_codon:yes gene_type:complete